MIYVYVLLSEKDSYYYVGFTNDVCKRLTDHNNGKVKSTKNRRPFKLIYYEASLDIDDAIKREKYLKTTYGRRYIKNRLRNYFLSLKCL